MALLSVAQLLVDVLESFKVQVPMLVNGFATDFSNQQIVAGQTLQARIATMPPVATYDANNGGYKNGATSANTLLVDVPVVVDQHKHVPIKLPFTDVIATSRDLYNSTVRNAAYVLGKGVVDYALSKVLVANLSNRIKNSAGAAFAVDGSAGNEFDMDALSWLKRDMNKSGALPDRYVIVNSDRYLDLDADNRITSKDYYGQKTEGNPYGWIKNVAGFSNIWEYPDMPTNGENLVGLAADKNAILVATRLPQHGAELASQLGLPSNAKFETMRDPDSGLALLGITWIEQGTFDVYTTVALLYGASVGKQGGSSGAITDKGGFRIRSTAGA